MPSDLHLRKKSEGRPIGLKFAAGRIEDDLEYACYAKPDFITIDGRGGSTGTHVRRSRGRLDRPKDAS